MTFRDRPVHLPEAAQPGLRYARHRFHPERAAPISEFASRAASPQLLGDGHAEAHVYAVHVGAGGEIGPHMAGFGQLFLVVAGEGWVASGDGVRRPIRAGQGAVIARGEVHAKGSATGLAAVMIQLFELAPAGDDGTRA